MIDWIGSLLTWLAAAVLVTSGVLKFGTAASFQLTLSQFGLPRWTWKDERFARAFPWIELVLGLGAILLPSPWQVVPSIGILALFIGFLVLVIQVSRRPSTVSCNCFGGLGDDTVGTRTIVRNAVLVALALAAVAAHRSPASVGSDRLAGWCYPLPALLALAVAGALVVCRTVATRRRRAHLVRTLTVQDVDGNEMPITEFQDPPTFLVFFSSGCGSCHSVVEHFRWWPNLLKDGWDLQPVFLGRPEEFRSQEAFAPLVEHAWYADRSLAGAMQVAGTPGVAAVDAEHPLGHLATSGHGAIQELVLRTGWRDELPSESADQTAG
ncbi:MAG TPA: MauE/DoxX family redox-associated membrane protein [Flexivirga sp.]|uniref:TlpA family protein disulfide reductase n=1 Tax=Flexivirga sp. TaxID=1962927 RepID=UPI002CFA54BD|nr:MauE/DoxX family redox-associated membrane protein [Flexivirga sp.]HWC20897.1 MauE/DoxX family redox-associated membrane protein [Flexivirga sp.]